MPAAQIRRLRKGMVISMEEKKNKCPLCNKKLVMKGGVPTCPDCGYRDPYRSGSSQSRPGYGGQNQTNNNGQFQSNGSQSQPGYGGQNQTNNNGRSQSNGSQSGSGYNGQPQAGGRPQVLGPYAEVVKPIGKAEEEKEKNAQHTAAVITVVIVIIVIVTVILTASLAGFYLIVNRSENGGRSGARDYDSVLQSLENNFTPSIDYRQSSAIPESSEDRQSSNAGASTEGRGNGSVSHLTFEQPESKLLQEFVSQLFDKPAASATREDLNSVIKLEIHDMHDYSGVEVLYELSDGTAGTCYLQSAPLETEDFKCFPMLQTLDLGRKSLDWGTDWYYLTSLSELACQSSPGDLAENMDVSQLTALDLSCDFMMSDLSELCSYTNLKYLRLDCGGRGIDLSGLSQAASLETLIIEDGDGISDFGELYDMTQLKELSIDSDGLNDIGFISAMDGLESLELCNTRLTELEAVSDCADTLKCLKLHLNSSVEDYAPVFECTGLQELELFVRFDINEPMEMPDLSMMPELKTLTLGNYQSFSGLKDLKELESLTLADGSTFGVSWNLEGVEGLTNLKSLSLLDMSMEPEFLEMFAKVESLERIDLTDSFIWGDINVVFGLPNVKELHLENTDFGLNIDEMPVCESLLELDMRDANVHQLRGDGSWDFGAANTKTNLGGHTEFFDHMPNLTSLAVPDQELRNVDFAKNLTQLAYLNIRNNNITDLSPLAGLGKLKVIICENNPVNDRTGLKNVIIFG